VPPLLRARRSYSSRVVGDERVVVGVSDKLPPTLRTEPPIGVAAGREYRGLELSVGYVLVVRVGGVAVSTGRTSLRVEVRGAGW
jgi:hypothetical protein